MNLYPSSPKRVSLTKKWLLSLVKTTCLTLKNYIIMRKTYNYILWNLSGSHTTGKARCLLFRNRIYNETNIDSEFAKSIQSNCPSSGGGDDLSPLDDGSPVIFDNSYFKNLVNKKGLLHSDQALFNGGSMDSQVTTYSENPITFKVDFANAMVKMGNLSVLTGTDGEIRTNCRKVNWFELVS